MERFKRAMGQRFQPVTSVHSTRECDAVVRTSTSFDSLSSALAAHGGCRFVPLSSTTPPAWQDAVSRLEAALRLDARPDALVSAYVDELEACTASAAHDFLATPLTRVVAAWVSQTGLQAALTKIAKPGEAPVHVVLVARQGSRQDDAASDPAAAAARATGAKGVHLLRLGEERGPNTVAAVADAIVAGLHAELAARSDKLSEAAVRLRRAHRSAFRSWFGAPPTPTATLRRLSSPPPNGDVSPSASASGATPSPSSHSRRASPRNAASPAIRARHRRSGSFGGDLEHTPLFDPDSLESVARQLADLQMLVGRYEEASEGYRTLASDFRSLTGAARVHEAAATEMLALALALVDGPKLDVGRALERSVSLYVSSGRTELAVRAAFRVVDYCVGAVSTDNAGPLLVRAIGVIFANGGGHTSPGILPLVPDAPGSFLDGAAGVLHALAALTFSSSRKPRRAALHAFLAAGRLAKLNLHTPAAAFLRLTHPRALIWPSVQDEYELVLGQAEIYDGSPVQAVRHFTRILANATDESDVELQSSVVRQLSAAVGKGAVDGMLKGWEAGATFPPVVADEVRVDTNDSAGEREEECRLAEDAILTDFEHFRNCRDAVAEGRQAPEREKPVEAVIDALRGANDAKDPGGSLENKIQRIREKDGVTRKRRRVRSLLERCAVVGEHIQVTVSLRNPLHFPVFVNDMTPVVTMDGVVFAAVRADEATRNHRTGRSPFRKYNSATDDGDGFSPSDPTFPVEFLPLDEIVLGPRSVQDIPLNLVVHRQGVLRVVGAQWLFTVGMGDSRSRAASPIPGFAKLERRGRRLNDTRSQRASGTPEYAQDTSLELEVTAPEARIVVEFHCKSESTVDGDDRLLLRAGELKKATLTLTNDGAVEANGIVFRIDTPQSLFLDTDELQFSLSRSSSPAGEVQLLDAAGDVVSYGAPVVAGFLPVALKPGAQISQSVWLRASIPASSLQSSLSKPRRKVPGETEEGPPSSTFAVTFAYGDDRARVCRHEGRIFVRPSVFVSRRFMTRTEPSVLPVSDDHGGVGITIGVEVEHSAHSPGDTPVFQIDCLSVTSCSHWNLSPLPEKTKSVEAGAGMLSNKATTLRANETATLFAVLSSKEASEGETNTGEWATSQMHIGLDPDEAASPTSINRLAPIPTIPGTEPFDAAARHFVLTNQIAGVDRRSTADLTCVAVRWAEASGARGELYLHPLDLPRWLATHRPASRMETRSSSFVSLTASEQPESLEEESREIMRRIAEEAPALQVTVKHKARFVHQFERATAQGRVAVPAVVSVQVCIRNVSSRLLDVSFAAAPHSSIADGDRGRFWAGDIAMSLRALPPDSERFLQLTAILERPGRYNMAQFVVKYQISLMQTAQRKIPVNVESSFLVVELGGKDVQAGGDDGDDGLLGTAGGVDALLGISDANDGVLGTPDANNGLLGALDANNSLLRTAGTNDGLRDAAVGRQEEGQTQLQRDRSSSRSRERSLSRSANGGSRDRNSTTLRERSMSPASNRNGTSAIAPKSPKSPSRSPKEKRKLSWRVAQLQTEQNGNGGRVMSEGDGAMWKGPAALTSRESLT